MARHVIPYKGFQYAAIVDTDFRRVILDKNLNLSKEEIRELNAIITAYYVLECDGEKFSREDAKRFAAYLLMEKDRILEMTGKNILDFTPEDLAELARVTPDFAKYRIELEKDL